MLLLLALLAGRPALGCKWKASRPVTGEVLDVAEDEQRTVANRLGALTLVGALRLRSRDVEFGGFSALQYVDGRLFALSDRGTLWRFDPAILAAAVPAPAPWQRCALYTGSGRPDSESLAVAGDGTLFLAAEGEHALYHLDPEAKGRERLATRLPLPAWLRAAPVNAGIEAATALSGGRLLLFTEGLFLAPGVLRAALRDGSGFVPLRYPASEGFVPVGADSIGDTVYVLERRFSLFGGFAGRILALELPGRPVAETLLAPRELARLRAPLPSDNFEGITVWQGEDGAREIAVVSDDNFSALQATLLLRLRHRPQASGAAD